MNNNWKPNHITKQKLIEIIQTLPEHMIIDMLHTVPQPVQVDYLCGYNGRPTSIRSSCVNAHSISISIKYNEMVK
jgi:hypothetical protein